MLALNPSAIARPAASSEPLLMREPDDIRNSVLCRFDPVIASWFCAARDGILFRMLNAIRFLLFVWSRLPWNVLPRFRSAEVLFRLSHSGTEVPSSTHIGTRLQGFRN